MLFNSKFLFDTDANDGAGGGDNNTPTPEILTDEIKNELNELRQYRDSITKREPEKTPEQIKKDEEVEKVNFRKYSVENDLFHDDEFNTYETLKSKQNRDLIFENHFIQFKEDNPTIQDEKQLLELATEDFEAEYKLNSENETAKKRGLARIDKEASAIKNPFESKYNSALESYTEDKGIKQKYPAYNAFMDEVIKENTPEKFTVKIKDGEEEVPIELDLTDEQKKEIEKKFKNPQTFRDYIKGGDKKDELKKAISAEINGFIKINNFEKGIEKGYQTGHGIGLKKGSTVGAENPFGLKQKEGQNNGGATVISLEESNQKIGEARRNVRR